ncbi:hypothetical protein Ahia01_000734800 [Argonauta hians]
MFESQDAVDLKGLKHSTGRILELKYFLLKLSISVAQSKCLNCRMCVNILEKRTVRKPFRSDALYFPKKNIRHIHLYNPVQCCLKNNLNRKSCNGLYNSPRNDVREHFLTYMNILYSSSYSEHTSKMFCVKFQDYKPSTADVVLYDLDSSLNVSGCVFFLHSELNMFLKKLYLEEILLAKSAQNNLELEICLKTKRKLLLKPFQLQGFLERYSEYSLLNYGSIMYQLDPQYFLCITQKYSKLIYSLLVDIDELNHCQKYRNCCAPIYELKSIKHCITYIAVFMNDIFEFILDICQPALEAIIVLLINLEFHLPFMLTAQRQVIEFWKEFYTKYLQSLYMKPIKLQKFIFKLVNSSLKILMLFIDLIIITSLNINGLNYLLVIILQNDFSGFNNFFNSQLIPHRFNVNNSISGLHKMLQYVNDNLLSLDECIQCDNARYLHNRICQENLLSFMTPSNNILDLLDLIRNRKAIRIHILLYPKSNKLIDISSVLAIQKVSGAKLLNLPASANVLYVIEQKSSPKEIKCQDLYCSNSLYIKTYKQFYWVPFFNNLLNSFHNYLRIFQYENAMNFWMACTNFASNQPGHSLYSKSYGNFHGEKLCCSKEFTQCLQQARPSGEHGRLALKINILDLVKLKLGRYDAGKNKNAILYLASFSNNSTFSNNLEYSSDNYLNIFHMVEILWTSLIGVCTIPAGDSLCIPLDNCKYGAQYLCTVLSIRLYYYLSSCLNRFRFELCFHNPISKLDLKEKNLLCFDAYSHPSFSNVNCSKVSLLKLFCEYFSSTHRTKLKLIETFIISRIFTSSFKVLNDNRLFTRKNHVHTRNIQPKYPVISDRNTENCLKMCNDFSISTKNFKLRQKKKFDCVTISIINRKQFGNLLDNSIGLKQNLSSLKTRVDFIKSELSFNNPLAKLFCFRTSTSRTQILKHFTNKVPILSMHFTLCVKPIETDLKVKDFFDDTCHSPKLPNKVSLEEPQHKAEPVTHNYLCEDDNSNYVENNPIYQQLPMEPLGYALSNPYYEAPSDFPVEPPLHMSAPFNTGLNSCKESNPNLYSCEMDDMMSSYENGPTSPAIPVPAYGLMKAPPYYCDVYFDSGHGLFYSQTPVSPTEATLKRPMIQRSLPYFHRNSFSHDPAWNFSSPVPNGYVSFTSRFQRKPVPHLSDPSFKDPSMRRKTKRYHRKYSAFPPDPEFEAAFRRTMVEQFATFTNYPFEFSKWCLEWSQWDYGKAAQTFIYNEPSSFGCPPTQGTPRLSGRPPASMWEMRNTTNPPHNVRMFNGY